MEKYSPLRVIEFWSILGTLKDVIVSDKTLNAVFRFHVPEAFN